MDPFFKKSSSSSSGGQGKNGGFFKGGFKNKQQHENSNKTYQNDEKNKGNLRDFKSSKNKQNQNKDDRNLHEIKDGKVDKGSKPFDKKLYRMKKYSNKYKLDQWENKRRKEVLKKYYKDIKNDPMAGSYRPFKFDEGKGEGFDELDNNRIHFVLNPDRLEEMKLKFGKGKKFNEANQKNNMKPFRKVKEEMQRLKEEKIAAKEAKMKAAKEKEEAIAKYKAKKAERFKKLSKKTKTGQPVMRDRMQMLLEEIQRST